MESQTNLFSENGVFLQVQSRTAMCEFVRTDSIQRIRTRRVEQRNEPVRFEVQVLCNSDYSSAMTAGDWACVKDFESFKDARAFSEQLVSQIDAALSGHSFGDGLIVDFPRVRELAASGAQVAGLK